MTDSLPQPYKEEIEGISSATGLPVSTVTLYNIFYEAFTLCTSLVVQDQSGHLYHARNLDTGVFLGLVIFSFGLFIITQCYKDDYISFSPSIVLMGGKGLEKTTTVPPDGTYGTTPGRLQSC